MIPLFQIFDKTISIYMVMAVLGILATLFVTYKLAKHYDLDEIHMLYMTLFAFAGSFVCGSLVYGLTNLPLLRELLANLDKIDSFGTLFEQLRQIFGGSVFYGGLLGILLVSWIYTRRKKLSRRYFDVVAIAVPLFHTFGRIGCFLGGCCYGIACDFGFVYHHSPVSMANEVRRFPVQLLEVGFNLALVLVFYRMFRQKKLQGWLINCYLYAYPVFRFADEYLRGDTYRGFLWGFSTSQWISILLIVGNTVYLLCRARAKRQQQDAIV